MGVALAGLSALPVLDVREPTWRSRRHIARELALVVEHRCQPTLGLLEAPALALSVVFDLVALDLADAEVMAIGVRQIKTRDASRRPHGVAFSEANARRLFRLEQVEDGCLFGVIGLRG